MPVSALRCFRGSGRVRPLHLWQRSDLAFQYLFDLPAVDAQFLKEEIRDVFPHLEDTGQQVLRFDGLLSPCLYKVDGFLNGLLGLDGKFVKKSWLFPFYI